MRIVLSAACAGLCIRGTHSAASMKVCHFARPDYRGLDNQRPHGREEQRRPRGCIAGRMPSLLSPRAARCVGCVRRKVHRVHRVQRVHKVHWSTQRFLEPEHLEGSLSTLGTLGTP
jgi:hypothetical protein